MYLIHNTECGPNYIANEVKHTHKHNFSALQVSEDEKQ